MEQLFYGYWTAMLVASFLALGACATAPKPVEQPVVRCECIMPKAQVAPTGATSFEQYEQAQDTEAADRLLKLQMDHLPDQDAPESEWKTYARDYIP